MSSTISHARHRDAPRLLARRRRVPCRRSTRAADRRSALVDRSRRRPPRGAPRAWPAAHDAARRRAIQSRPRQHTRRSASPRCSRPPERGRRVAPVAGLDQQRNRRARHRNRRCAARSARSAAARISGCRIASSRRRSAVREGRARMPAAVERAVGSDELGAEGRAALPRSRRRRASVRATSASVSTTPAPRLQHAGHRALAAADAAGQADAKLAGTQTRRTSPVSSAPPNSMTMKPGRRRDRDRTARIRRPRSVNAIISDADDRADHRGQQHDRQDHLPAQPGAERGEQLEVAEAHAFLAGGELEDPVDRPEQEVAGDRAPDRVCSVSGIESSRARRAGRPRAAAASGCRAAASCPQSMKASATRTSVKMHHSSDGRSVPKRQPPAPTDGGQRLDQRIARRDPRSAAEHTAAQPAASSAPEFLTRRRSAWPHEGQRERGTTRVKRSSSSRRDAVQLGALRAPLALQHQRQAMDDDVQEAADAEAESSAGERGAKRRARSSDGARRRRPLAPLKRPGRA